ncbi:MAG: hypothetical protein RLZZ337_71 [Bacteroidota bacterium]|jgi:O-antigen/teichoic acid export membrane protein
MGVVARQSFKSGIVTFGGIVFGMANTVIFYPYFLSVEQIGVLSFVAQVSMLMMPFILLGFGTVVVKYFAYYQDSKTQKNYFYSLLVTIVFATTIIFVLLYLFFFQRLENHFGSDDITSLTLMILLGITALMPISEVYQQYSSSYQRTAVPAMLNQFYKIITPILAAGYYFGLYSFDFVLVGILVFYLMLTITYRLYLMKLDTLNFKWLKLSTIKADPNIKPMFAFAIFGLIGGLGYSFSNQIDILILTDMSGSYQTGIYSLAFNIANAIATPLTLVAAIGVPLLATYWKNNDLKSINLFYKQTASTLFVISLGLFFAVLIGLDDLFALMPKGDKFSASKTTFIILGVAKLIDLAAGLNNQIIAMSKDYLYNVFFMLITAALNVILNYFLIPDYGLEGCAFATLISVLIFNAIKVLFIFYKYKMHPFQVSMLYTLFIGSVLALLVLISPKFEYNILNIAIFSPLFLLVYALLNYKFKLAPELNNFVNKQFLRFGIKPFD